MQMIDFKADKLLRIEVDMKQHKIDKIKISGDFFIHPEHKIIDIEKCLKGLSINEVASALRQFLADNNIQVIGFRPGDVQEALKILKSSTPG